MVWLLLWYEWRHRDRHRDSSPSDAGSAGTTLVVALLLLPLVLPWLVWVAVRDNGQGRLAAAWWVSLAGLLVALVGALEGPWWAVLAAAGGSAAALTHIGVRATRDRVTQERAFAEEDDKHRTS